MPTKRKSWDDMITQARSIFRRWKIDSYAISPGKAPRRRDRYHYPAERIVKIRWKYYGRLVELQTGKEDIAHDNLQLLVMVLDALYLNDVRKTAELVASAYRQMHLSPPAPAPTRDESNPYVLLGVTEDYPLPVIESIWKAHLRVAHPDAGGTTEQAAKLNAAIDKIRGEKASKY